jgi:hypothetical protein
MIDSIYDCLATVLKISPEPIPPTNIWNFDETGTKAAYVSTFLYGLRVSRLNQGEKTGGQGEHVTMGAFVNVAGDFLKPIFLFCGAESSQPNIRRKLPGMVMHQRTFKAPKVLYPKANVITAPENVEVTPAGPPHYTFMYPHSTLTFCTSRFKKNVTSSRRRG